MRSHEISVSDKPVTVKTSVRLLRLILQLVFFIYGTIGVSAISGDELTVSSFMLCCTVSLTVFLLTFGAVYKASGSSFMKTVFIQGGGIFAVIHMVFPIFLWVGYGIYEAVKESFVIPNFTEQQICGAREFYHRILDLLIITLGSFWVFTVLPLVISSVIWFTVKKRSQKKVLNEMTAE